MKITGAYMEASQKHYKPSNRPKSSSWTRVKFEFAFERPYPNKTIRAHKTNTHHTGNSVTDIGQDSRAQGRS